MSKIVVQQKPQTSDVGVATPAAEAGQSKQGQCVNNSGHVVTLQPTDILEPSTRPTSEPPDRDRLVEQKYQQQSRGSATAFFLGLGGAAALFFFVNPFVGIAAGVGAFMFSSSTDRRVAEDKAWESGYNASEKLLHEKFPEAQ